MSIIFHSDGLLGNMTGTVYGEQVTKARVGRVPALDHPGRALIDRPDRLQLGTLSQQLLEPALPFSGS